MNWSNIIIYVLCFVALVACWYTIQHLDAVYDKCYAKVVEMCGTSPLGYKNYTLPDNYNLTAMMEMINNGT